MRSDEFSMDFPLHGSKFRVLRALCVTAILCLPLGCKEVESEKPNQPRRTASASNSSITGTGGEVGVAQTVTVTLKDSKGFGVFKAVPVITAVSATGATLSGISAGGCTPTGANGVSTCTITSNNPSPAGSPFLLKVTSPISFTGGSIAFHQVTRSIQFGTQPNTTATSAGDLGDPTVRLLDRLGNLVTTGTDTVSLSLTNPGDATLSGTSSVSAVGGVATFGNPTNLTVDLVGTYTFTASIGSITAASNSFTVTAGAAHHLIFSTSPSGPTAANTAFTTQPIVKLVDAAGNTVTPTGNCVVTISLEDEPNGVGTDTLLGTVSKLMSSTTGIADFSGLGLRIGTTLGGTGYTLAADGSGAGCNAGLFTAESDEFEITRSGIPTQIVFLTPPSSTGSLLQDWTTQPIVEIQDEFGQRVGVDSSTIVTVTAASAGNSGVLTGGTSVQAVNGTVTFGGLSIDSTDQNDDGIYTLTFTGVSSLNPSATLTLTHNITINANGLTGTKLVFKTEPQNVAVSEPMPTDVEVKITDAAGNTCITCSNTITVALTAASTGTLAGTVSATPSLGVAKFPGLRVTTPGVASGTKQLTATDAGVHTAGNSALFAVSSFGTKTKLTFTQQPSTAATGQSSWTTQPIVAIQDAQGNTVTNDNSTQVTIGIAQASGTATLVGTQTIQAQAGIATFTDLRTQQTGLTNLVIEASASPTLIKTQSNSFNGNTGGTATQMSIFTQPDTPDADANVTLDTQPVIRLLDAFGNLSTGDSATVVTASGCTAEDGAGDTTVCTLTAGTTTATAVNGVVTFANLGIDETDLENVVITFTSPNMSSVNSNSFEGRD